MGALRAGSGSLSTYRRIAKPVVGGIALGVILWWNHRAQAAPGPLPNIAGTITTMLVIGIVALIGLGMLANPKARDLGLQWLGAAGVATITFVACQAIS